METRLSKSTYLAGKQCHLRLWHNFHARHLATPYDEAQLLTFAAGHEVGELACRRYPGGHRIAHDHHQVPEALAETQRILKAGTAPALFEPAFEHDHVFMRPDVLERLPTAGWRLVEVKSTLSVKPVFIRDVALQLWVLRGAGVDVRDAGVLTLNRGYVYDGVGLDVDALFKFHPVFEQALALQDGIRADAQAMRAMLARTEAPAIAPGDHCFDPYACAYHAHCTRGLARQEHPIAELPRVTAARRAELEAAGIREIKDIPDDFPLNRLQKVVRRAVRQSRVQVRRRQLDRALAAIKPPVRHLDFETFAPAIPRFAGARALRDDPLSVLGPRRTRRPAAGTHGLPARSRRRSSPRAGRAPARRPRAGGFHLHLFALRVAHLARLGSGAAAARRCASRSSIAAGRSVPDSAKLLLPPGFPRQLLP